MARLKIKYTWLIGFVVAAHVLVLLARRSRRDERAVPPPPPPPFAITQSLLVPTALPKIRSWVG